MSGTNSPDDIARRHLLERSTGYGVKQGMDVEGVSGLLF
jgi:hypothetical protein